MDISDASRTSQPLQFLDGTDDDDLIRFIFIATSPAMNVTVERTSSKSSLAHNGSGVPQ